MTRRPLTPLFEPKIRYGDLGPVPVWKSFVAGGLTDQRDTAAGTGTAYVSGLAYLGHLAGLPSFADMDITDDGKHLVAVYSGGFYIINIEDPTAPYLRGTVLAGSQQSGVAVDGNNYAYATGGSTHDMHRYDMTDKDNPTHAATYQWPNWGYTYGGLEIAGGKIVICRPFNAPPGSNLNRATLNGASDPTGYTSLGAFRSVAARYDAARDAIHTVGSKIYGLIDYATWTVTGSFSSGSQMSNVSKVAFKDGDDYVFCTDMSNTTWVMDISTPASPVVHHSWVPTGFASKAIEHNQVNHVFIGGSALINSYDISDPDAPVLEGSFTHAELTGVVNESLFRNDILYVMTSTGRLLCIDAAHP
jgi:hypothetical protein